MVRRHIYFLRAKPADNLIPVGGHYRITVSDNGQSAEQVDQLFASCLTLDRKSAPAGGEMVGISMSHVVSSSPLETHVFLSLQEHLPFYVMTRDSTIWHVEAGRMERVNTEAKDAPRAPST